MLASGITRVGSLFVLFRAVGTDGSRDVLQERSVVAVG
jgi:hypothetical protein